MASQLPESLKLQMDRTRTDKECAELLGEWAKSDLTAFYRLMGEVDPERTAAAVRRALPHVAVGRTVH